MPTHEESEAFLRYFDRLTPTQQNRFRTALGRFVNDLWAIETGNGHGSVPASARNGSRQPGAFMK